MALNGLFCADVPLRNYSLTHSLTNSSTAYTDFTPTIMSRGGCLVKTGTVRNKATHCEVLGYG